MATNNQKEVDLIIRAKDMSAQAMKDAKKAIDEVTSSLADQVKQAKAATAGTGDLGKASASLSDQQKNLSKAAEAVQKAMSAAADALDQAKTRAGAAAQAFNSANENLDRHKRSVEGAALAYQMFARDALNAGPPTRSTARELDKLAASAAGGGRDFERLTARVAKTGQDMQSAQARTASLTKSMAELSGLETQVAGQSEQVAKAMSQQAQATQAAASATDRLNARQSRSQAAGAAIVAAGREQAARDAAAQAQQAKAEAKAFDDRLARIRAAAAAQAAAVSKDLSMQSQQANAIKGTTSALAGHNAEGAKTVSLLDKITTGNRESLSWYQRVRGELIALATAYVGVQGAISLAASALDATRKYDANHSILAVVAGSNDEKLVGQQYAYAAAQAERLGVRIDELTQSYGKFAVSAKLAGATSNQTRYIFERVAEAGRVLHLSNDDLTGTFIALEQMMSKGQIMTEELRNQLGNRIPGAFELMAKGMNITLPELNKRLKAGSVGVKELLGFSQQLAETYSHQLPTAIENMMSAEARLYNAFFEFRKMISDAGFGEAWKNFAKDLTTLMRSADGAQMAKNLSAGFSSVLGILETIIKNINAIGDVIALVLGVKVMASIGAFTIKLTEAAFAMSAVGAASTASAAGVETAGVAMDAAAVQAGRLQAALAGINKIFLILTAAFTGWQIGKILGEKFEIARLAGTAAAESIYEAWINVKYGILVLAAQMADSVVDFFDKSLKKIATLKNGFLGGLRSTAEFLGLDNVAEQLGKGISDGAKTGFEEAKSLAQRNLASIRAERDKALADNKAAFDVLYQQDLRRQEVRLARPKPTGTPLTDTTGGLYDLPDADKKDKNADKRYNMELALSEKLNQLWKGVEQKYKDNLDLRLQAVNRTFKEIADTIQKYQKIGGTSVDGKPIAAIKAEIEEIRKQAVQQETLQFNTEQLKKKEEAVNDVLKERTEFQKDILEQVKGGTLGAADGFKQIALQVEKTSPKLAQMAKDAAAFANGVRGTGIPDAKIDAFVSKMNRVGNDQQSGAASAAAKGGLDVFNQQMTETNNLLSERNATVSMYNNLVQLGAITQDEANQKIKAAYVEAAPQIQRMVAEMQTLLNTMAEAGDISGSKLDALNAKLKEISTQTQYVDKDMATLRDALTGGLSKGISDTMGNIVDQLLAAADGTQKWSDAFKNIGVSVANFASQFLRQMASVIMQIMATRAAMALLGMFGGAGSAAAGTGLGTWGLGAAVPAAIAHSGAVVGQPGGMSRSASASWFANAPRYHSGTVVGLKADEQAAILQKGEEVLAKDNPRNILNQTAKSAAQAAKQPMSIRNVLVSDPNFVPDAMSSAQGDQVITTYLRQNAVTAKQALGIK